MKRIRTAITAVMMLFVATTATAQPNSIDELPWQLGPTHGKIGTSATVKVPEGYVFLDPAGARDLNRLTQNPSPAVDEYVLAKKDLSWIAFFSFNPSGYVKDNETLEPEALLKSVSDGTEASNEERRNNGWAPIHVTGWAFQPKYDTTIKSLEWAFRLKGEQSADESINYNTRLLGRRGVMEVQLVTSPDQLQASVADFKAKLPGYAFNAGETYAEFREGDHVAEYGLAALVTGGAVAVASKKGLFAVIGAFLLKGWKLILIVVAAAGAGLRKFFGSKDQGPTA